MVFRVADFNCAGMDLGLCSVFAIDFYVGV